MNQLTIEHLSPFLPHKIWVENLSYQRDYTGVLHSELTSFYSLVLKDGSYSWCYKTTAGNVGSICDCKPILRPLDLTKEITHRGETFAPVDRMYAIANSETERSFVNVLLHLKRYESDDIDKTHKDIFSRAPYSMHCYACEHHFDVFGLIPAGLAIDVNTLEFNPYEK